MIHIVAFASVLVPEIGHNTLDQSMASDCNIENQFVDEQKQKQSSLNRLNIPLFLHFSTDSVLNPDCPELNISPQLVEHTVLEEISLNSRVL